MSWILCSALTEAIKKNTLDFGNAVDEKNLYLGGRKFIFLTDLIEFLKQMLHL